ncbi:MAG TPA: type II toxin-antitoxin system prevent-host-death family antitoxin [Acidobacteriaceae bacterium]
MRTVKAGEFKAKCLALMDEVQASGEPLVITKRGKPVVRITPLESKPEKSAGSILGFMRNKTASQVTVTGDIVGPIIPAEEWRILSESSEDRK